MLTALMTVVSTFASNSHESDSVRMRVKPWGSQISPPSVFRIWNGLRLALTNVQSAVHCIWALVSLH